MTKPIDITTLFGEEVTHAARAFAEALSETAEFQIFEQAMWNLHQDKPTQALAQQLQAMQVELEPLHLLGVPHQVNSAEFEQLQSTYLNMPTVVAYMEAEDNLRLICQKVNQVISAAAGVDFAAQCNTGGCC